MPFLWKCHRCSLRREVRVITFLYSRRLFFCSPICYEKWLRGGGRPGYYPLTSQWRRIRKHILERDNYSCVMCNSKEHLVVDHVIPYRVIGYHDPKWLVTMCGKCHRKYEVTKIPKDLKDYYLMVIAQHS